MTPQARLSAAIEVLDRILAGASAEQALTNWGRASRFAGSGDRAALRDLVFDALRCKRSYAALGGALSGRGLVLGGLRDRGFDPAEWFTGEGHAPSVLCDGDTGFTPAGNVALDCPEWLAEPLQAALGADFAAVMQALRRRAPVFLRVNLAKASVAQAMSTLAAEGIVCQLNQLAKTALEVTDNARKIQNSQAYLGGLVELQDAASQAVIEALPLADGQRVLDYCSGGGGKALAMAAQAQVKLVAHDADPRRMRDIPARAARAGVSIAVTETQDIGKGYDLILTDVPCSGSGSWRRDPQGKWALTEARLTALCQIQADILDRAAGLLGPTGTLAYATCSMLGAENEHQIAAFLERHRGWSNPLQRRFSPLQGADGFFVALLTREA
ncbi:MAG: RsmB/NOP family class I SAM-dependent RNA methyltransferase [Cypionkella sp.]|uniref:RsmB/NOP family class I SAM-dependent RNA methyltransferase n=1 Tax=Cypionkella sp. TaxID=2811411 RepID=UPI002ABCD430|nr:RsmB/NOP family class I SAM-dependent RNA methyltransferase [Cypionkella sp.]MDZ4312416.1 RsmB/NOP family class I SAM-dependent RNA methyltransferase [Cypionkella sp.]